MHNRFDNLEKGSMTIAKYATHFYTLSKYSATSISIESERILKFIKGLDGVYQLVTTQMVVLGSSFQSIIKHSKDD